METFKIDQLYPSYYDEHVSPIKQLALWQHIFNEMGYELSIEHRPSAIDNNENIIEENVIYHVIKRNNPDEHYIIAYCREIKQEYDF